MERGSVVDAEIELRDQVGRLNPFELAVLYQESIDRNWRIIKELIAEAEWKRNMAVTEALMAAATPRRPIFFI